MDPRTSYVPARHARGGLQMLALLTLVLGAGTACEDGLKNLNPVAPTAETAHVRLVQEGRYVTPNALYTTLVDVVDGNGGPLLNGASRITATVSSGNAAILGTRAVANAGIAGSRLEVDFTSSTPGQATLAFNGGQQPATQMLEFMNAPTLHYLAKYPFELGFTVETGTTCLVQGSAKIEDVVLEQTGPNIGIARTPDGFTYTVNWRNPYAAFASGPVDLGGGATGNENLSLMLELVPGASPTMNAQAKGSGSWDSQVTVAGSSCDIVGSATFTAQPA